MVYLSVAFLPLFHLHDLDPCSCLISFILFFSSVHTIFNYVIRLFIYSLGGMGNAIGYGVQLQFYPDEKDNSFVTF